MTPSFANELDPASGKALLLGLGMIAAFLAWKCWRWFCSSPVPSSPWSAEEEKALEQADARPLCPRCLETHSGDSYFCPNCGATTGEFTTFSPYLAVLSLGDLLRQGTSGRIHVSLLTVTGYVFLSLAYYTVFAPIYWYFLARNIRLQRALEAVHAEDGSPPDS